MIGVIIGGVLGWFWGAGIMYTLAIRSCPDSENTQCEYFGNQKICIVGDK